MIQTPNFSCTRLGSFELGLTGHLHDDVILLLLLLLLPLPLPLPLSLPLPLLLPLLTESVPTDPTGRREKLGTRLGFAFLCKLGLLLVKPQI